jgi:hypothetical protein
MSGEPQCVSGWMNPKTGETGNCVPETQAPIPNSFWHWLTHFKDRRAYQKQRKAQRVEWERKERELDEAAWQYCDTIPGKRWVYDAGIFTSPSYHEWPIKIDVYVNHRTKEAKGNGKAMDYNALVERKRCVFL